METIADWVRWLCRRKTCEDLYQDQRSEKYLENRPMIIARADFNEGEMKLTADNIKKRVETINQHLGQFHSYEISSDFVFDQPSMIQHYNDRQTDFKMMLQKNKSRVYVELDHRYIGGSMIGWVTYLINQTIDFMIVAGIIFLLRLSCGGIVIASQKFLTLFRWLRWTRKSGVIATIILSTAV